MTNGAPTGPNGDSPFGREQAQAAVALQKELLEAYEQASRAWLSRVQSEIVLWSELAARLSTTKSPTEALETYTKCVSERMQMAAEDGQRLLHDGQEITQKISRSLGGTWPSINA